MEKPPKPHHTLYRVVHYGKEVLVSTKDLCYDFLSQVTNPQHYRVTPLK